MITGGDQFSGRVSVGIRRAFGVEDKIRARAETDADNAGDYPGNPPETPFFLPDTEPEQAERQQQYAPVRQGSDALARLGAGQRRYPCGDLVDYIDAGGKRPDRISAKPERQAYQKQQQRRHNPETDDRPRQQVAEAGIDRNLAEIIDAVRQRHQAGNQIRHQKPGHIGNELSEQAAAVQPAVQPGGVLFIKSNQAEHGGKRHQKPGRHNRFGRYGDDDQHRKRPQAQRDGTAVKQNGDQNQRCHHKRADAGNTLPGNKKIRKRKENGYDGGGFAQIVPPFAQRKQGCTYQEKDQERNNAHVHSGNRKEMRQTRGAVIVIQLFGNRAAVADGQRFGDGAGVFGSVGVNQLLDVRPNTGYRIRCRVCRHGGAFYLKYGADSIADSAQAFIEVSSVKLIVAQRVGRKSLRQLGDKLNADAGFQPWFGKIQADAEIAFQVPLEIIDIGQQQPRAVVGIIIHILNPAAQIADFRQVMFQIAGTVHRIGLGHAQPEQKYRGIRQELELPVPAARQP